METWSLAVAGEPRSPRRAVGALEREARSAYASPISGGLFGVPIAIEGEVLIRSVTR